MRKMEDLLGHRLFQRTTREVNDIGHYLVHPRRPHRHEAFETFKAWLLTALGIEEGAAPA
ncbi:hypothetical protein BGC_42910 [Burkholderia sp. 3C]